MLSSSTPGRYYHVQSGISTGNFKLIEAAFKQILGYEPRIALSNLRFSKPPAARSWRALQFTFKLP